MKLFLATSFSSKVDYDTGRVLPEFRRELEALLAAVRAEGHEIVAAIEFEGWAINNLSPEDGIKNDLRAMDNADALLALLGDNASAGVQWEMGYMAALGKPVYAIFEAGATSQYWNRGLAGLGIVKFLEYDKRNPSQLAQALSGSPP